MARTQTISDKPAKAKCKQWLESIGFSSVMLAKNQSYDLIARKLNKVYYIEVKYSSKEDGGFFGTVMLTEMYQAICNKDNYLFLVCRGKGDNLEDWNFKLFSTEDFLKCCTLTTPIFLYHLDTRNNFELDAPKFTKNTTLATDELVKQMWKDFLNWKGK